MLFGFSISGVEPAVTMLLHATPVAAVQVPISRIEESSGWLVALLVVLLGYQQWRLYQMRQQTLRREELFRIVAENAADMIALVDVKGRRLYNSPAYEKILGYSPADLAKTPVFEQIHPEDRFKVLEAARNARETGIGKKVQYRMRHKDGTWRVLESTATTIKDENGKVEKLVIVNRDITEKKRAEEQLERNSIHDGLTGLPNRRLFLDRLHHCSMRARRNPDYQYAVLFLDVDGFKKLNQEMGKEIGDEVLREVARRASACLRTEDTVARPHGELPLSDAVLSRAGGDEFTFLLENITDPSDALRVARRIQSSVASPAILKGREVRVSASVGIALSMATENQPEDLLQNAETALHRAKALGGARCEVFDEAMHTRAVNRLALESELRAAIQQGEFRLHYQPIVRIKTREISGFEALVRWQHPQHGLISPYRFLDVAEDVGLMLTIGNWVLQQACRQLRVWQSLNGSSEPMKMTVNLSAKQFAHPELIKELRGTIQAANVEPSALYLELAEDIAMANPELTSQIFTQLKHLGVRISIGNFGMGHSSLGWLRRLPMDVLKIDRALIARVPTDHCTRDIVQLILSLGSELNLKIIAEGVETATQLECLKNMGCEFGQGYYFSQPVEAEMARQLLGQTVNSL